MDKAVLDILFQSHRRLSAVLCRVPTHLAALVSGTPPSIHTDGTSQKPGGPRKTDGWKTTVAVAAGPCSGAVRDGDPGAGVAKEGVQTK